MTGKIAGLAVAVSTLLLLPATAQDMPSMAMPAASCAAPTALPPALSGWSAKVPITAATGASGLDAAMLMPGQSVEVTLHPTHEVHYVTQPEKPGGSVASGGLLVLAIAEPGTYQVSLSSGAWIDMLKDGVAVMSSAHAPGPACSGIRKTVQFALQPGRYAIELSANADPAITVMVSKVP